MSDGVRQSSDTNLPKENLPTRRFFTFRQLNCLAVMIILSATGMISAANIAFVPFSVIYVYFLSKVAFPITSPHPDPPVFGERNTILGHYVLFAAVIGLILPVAYIVEGIVKGNKEGIEAAAPHLFLLASQVSMEGFTFWGNFSLPVRAFVPVFYNSRRIFSIIDWLRSEFSTVEDLELGGSTVRRLYVGRGLAVANMALWCFNLFGFLLPVYLPRAFKIYYRKIKD